MLTACVEQTGFGRVGSRYFGGLLKALQEELWSGRQASCFTNTLEETHDLEENRRALNFDGAAIEIWTFSTSTILKKKNRQINQKGHIVCKSRAGCELKLHSYSKSFLHFIKTLNSASDASLTNTGSLQPPLSPPAPPSAHISHNRIFGSGLLPFLRKNFLVNLIFHNFFNTFRWRISLSHHFEIQMQIRFGFSSCWSTIHIGFHPCIANAAALQSISRILFAIQHK